jgi:flagellar motor switch protein FliN/FliY
MVNEKDPLNDEDSDVEITHIVEKTDEEKEALTAITDKLNQFLDIPLTLKAELGKTTTTIREVLKLKDGTVIELDKLVGEPMEITINGLLIARGEVVVVNERFGIRVTDVIDPMEITRQTAGI